MGVILQMLDFKYVRVTHKGCVCHPHSGVTMALLATMQRHALVIPSPWNELLSSLPLSPSSFIAGSAATWIALRNTGRIPQWFPGDVDVFCLCDRTQFVVMVSEFADAMACALHPGFDISDTGQWKFDCPIEFLWRNHRHLLVSFIHVPSMPSADRIAHPTVRSVLGNFDIDVCRIAICSASEWMCTDHVYHQLLNMSMSFVLSESSDDIGYPMTVPYRIFKYMSRGFRLAYMHIAVHSAELSATPARVRFFNTAMMLLQHMMTISFHPVKSAVTFLPSEPDVHTPIQLNSMQHRHNVNATWIQLLSDIPLSVDVFIAGEAAAWIVLASKYISTNWHAQCVKVFCVMDHDAYIQLVVDFAVSSSCSGKGNVIDSIILAETTTIKITVMSHVGPVCFHRCARSSGALHTATISRILSRFDVSLCRVAVTARNGFFCNTNTQTDINDATFSFTLMPKPTSDATINRVHRFMSRGFRLKSMHMNLSGIYEMPIHERIAMFHNGMMLCMSLTNGATRHNQHTQLFGSGGINTLYPSTLYSIRELPPAHI